MNPLPLRVTGLIVVLTAVSGLVAASDLGQGAGSVTATDEARGFTLTLTVPQTTYMQGEAIGAVATLTYTGPDERVRFGYAAGGPVAFGIEGGGLRIAPGYREVCYAGTANRGIEVPYSFRASGGTGAPDGPDASFLENYVRHPGLTTLPPGTWRIWAETAISPGSCSADSIRLEASVRIRILPDAARTVPGN